MGAAMRGFLVYFTFLAAVILLPVTSQASIYNGDFEIIDPNSPAEFNAPDGWIRENYAAVTNKLLPLDQNIIYWKIDLEQGLLPFQGSSFVVLSTGDMEPIEPSYATLSQYIYAFSGQTLSGYYFFGTADYPDFYDFASIYLEPANPNGRNIVLVTIGVREVGKSSSTEGWVYFHHTFSSSEEGAYYLTFHVEDEGDEQVPSWLALDAVVLCNDPPDSGDINNDCYVDMVDFSWLATDWLEDCNDPNYIADPNSNCYKGTDLNDDGPVDINDLILITDNWLTGSG